MRTPSQIFHSLYVNGRNLTKPRPIVTMVTRTPNYASTAHNRAQLDTHTKQNPTKMKKNHHTIAPLM